MSSSLVAEKVLNVDNADSSIWWCTAYPETYKYNIAVKPSCWLSVKHWQWDNYQHTVFLLSFYCDSNYVGTRGWILPSLSCPVYVSVSIYVKRHINKDKKAEHTKTKTPPHGGRCRGVFAHATVWKKKKDQTALASALRTFSARPLNINTLQLWHLLVNTCPVYTCAFFSSTFSVLL